MGTVGRFVQLTELDASGNRTKLSVSLSSAGEFCDIISMFADLDTSALGKKAYTDASGRPTALRSEFMKMEFKQIHFDLCSNARGCVLKVSLKDGKRGRVTIMIPSQGLKILHAGLVEVIA